MFKMLYGFHNAICCSMNLHSVVKAGLLISIHDMVIYSNSAIYRSKYELKYRRLNFLNRHFKTTCKYFIGNPW